MRQIGGNSQNALRTGALGTQNGAVRWRVAGQHRGAVAEPVPEMPVFQACCGATCIYA